MEDLLISIKDKIFTSSETKYQCDLDGTIIKRSDGKQWEIKYNYKKHKLYLKKIMSKSKEILYYRKLKDKPLVQICNVPCMANLKLDYFTGKFAAITEEHFAPVGNKKVGIYSGFLYENRKIEFEFYDESFADDKKYTKKEVDNIEFPLMY